MTRGVELCIDHVDGRLYAAVVRKGVAQDLYVDPAAMPGSGYGAVFAAHVAKIDRALNAAIVELEGGEFGFLPLAKGQKIDPGAWIVVQVTAARKAGAGVEQSKLARLTLKIDPKEETVPAGPARLLRPAPDAVTRALADYGVEAFDHVHAGSRAALDLVLRWCEEPWGDPVLAESKRLRLFKPAAPKEKLFDRHDLFSVIEGLESPRVDLPSGGSLIIEPTCAMTVVDVNQGRAASPRAANAEAAEALARHLRLRNLSGTIVADFISLDAKPAREDLRDRMTAAVAADPAGVTVHGITRLGLVEMTRRRRGPALPEFPA